MGVLFRNHGAAAWSVYFLDCWDDDHCAQVQVSVWFGGKLVQKLDGFGVFSYPGEDRLGSVGKYLPYGEEKPGAAPTNPLKDNEKFATYTRDLGTGLDYADQRWHVPGTGRFLTGDPYEASGGPGDPGSWNRFAYVEGDPIRYKDPTGLVTDDGDCTWNEFTNTLSCTLPPVLPQSTPVQGKPNTTGKPSGPVTVDGFTFTGVGNTGGTESRILRALAWIAANTSAQCQKWLMGGKPEFTSFDDYLTQITQGGGDGTAMIGFAGNITSNNPNSVTNAVTGSGVSSLIIILNESGSGLSSAGPASHGSVYDRQVSAIKPGSFQMLLFIMFHEFAHSLNAAGFRSDAGNQNAGNLNNDDVWSNCGSTVKQATP